MDTDGKTVLATLKAGSYFGEISILNMGTAGALPLFHYYNIYTLRLVATMMIIMLIIMLIILITKATGEQPQCGRWATLTSSSSQRLTCGMCSKTTPPPGIDDDGWMDGWIDDDFDDDDAGGGVVMMSTIAEMKVKA